jgi:hypothetical protein
MPTHPVQERLVLAGVFFFGYFLLDKQKKVTATIRELKMLMILKNLKKAVTRICVFVENQFALDTSRTIWSGHKGESPCGTMIIDVQKLMCNRFSDLHL